MPDNPAFLISGLRSDTGYPVKYADGNANVQFFSTVPVRRTKYELVVSVQIQYGMFFAKNKFERGKENSKIITDIWVIPSWY